MERRAIVCFEKNAICKRYEEGECSAKEKERRIFSKDRIKKEHIDISSRYCTIIEQETYILTYLLTYLLHGEANWFCS